MKRLVAAIAVALLIPAAAQGKGLSQVQVCGADACRDAGIPAGLHDDPIDGSRASLAPPAGPYYELRISFEHGEQWRDTYYEPQSGLVSFTKEYGATAWAPVVPSLARAVKDAAKHVEPFPSPRLTAVYVGDRPVSGDASTYLALFGVKGPFVVPEPAADFDWIRFESPLANPWTKSTFAFYPGNGILLTGSTYVKLPPALAADIAAARPLDGGTDGGFRIPWIAVGAAIVGALLLLLLARRRTSAREVAPVH